MFFFITFILNKHETLTNLNRILDKIGELDKPHDLQDQLDKSDQVFIHHRAAKDGGDGGDPPS